MLAASALPVSPQAADHARAFLGVLGRLYDDAVFLPLTITPTVDGGVSAVWARGDRRVELVFVLDLVEYSVEVAGRMIEDGETRALGRVIRKIVHPYVTGLLADMPGAVPARPPAHD
jgi:hypothetical protein